ncbi:hypothetical protein J2T13_002588 [Paenibacillus sp. DS2015]|uniref:hypothetical protein n=1 Tax=Paenibacillus sp. DS2015 TaxID=3373917 RepID=UPI003D1E6FBC
MRMGWMIYLIIMTILVSGCNNTTQENDYTLLNPPVEIDENDDQMLEDITNHKLIVHSRGNIEAEYEPYHVILDPESVATVHRIINQGNWTKVKFEMSRPADYRISFQPTQGPHTEKISYEVWITNGYAELYIQELQSYKKLAKIDSDVLSTIMIQSISSAKEYTALLSATLPSLTTAQADIKLMELEEFYRIDLRKVHASFLDESTISAFKHLQNPITLEVVAQVPDHDAKQLAMDAFEGKYKLIEGEGVVVPIIDYRALLSYTSRLSPAMVAYLELMAVGSDNPMKADGGIIIEWDEIARRALQAEAYLTTYPQSPRYDQVELEFHKNLLSFFIGSSNTQIFESDRTLRPDVRTAFDQVIATHGDKLTGKLTEKFSVLLERLTKEYPAAEDVFKDPFYEEISKFIDALEERL